MRHFIITLVMACFLALTLTSSVTGAPCPCADGDTECVVAWAQAQAAAKAETGGTTDVNMGDGSVRVTVGQSSRGSGEAEASASASGSGCCGQQCPECPTCPTCPEPPTCPPTPCTEVIIDHPEPGTEWAYDNPPETEGGVWIVGAFGTSVFYGNVSTFSGTLTQEVLDLLGGLLPEGEGLAQVRLSCSPFYPADTPEPKKCYETFAVLVEDDNNASFRPFTNAFANGVQIYDGNQNTQFGDIFSLGVSDGFITDIEANVQLENGSEPGFGKFYPIPESGNLLDVVIKDPREVAADVPVFNLGEYLDNGRGAPIYQEYNEHIEALLAKKAELEAQGYIVLGLIHIEDSALASHIDGRVRDRNGDGVYDWIDVFDEVYLAYGYEITCPTTTE